MRSLVALAAVGLAGVLPAPSMAAPPGMSVSAEPASIDFGTLATGETAEQTVTLTNTSGTPVVLWGWGVEGLPFGLGEPDFFDCLVINRGVGALLLPGRSCPFSVTASTYDVGPSGVNYHPPGTYVGALVFWGFGSVERARVPLIVTID